MPLAMCQRKRWPRLWQKLLQRAATTPVGACLQMRLTLYTGRIRSIEGIRTINDPLRRGVIKARR
ncbi:hypothetical protein HMPREF0198_0945 [Cardiobacterium hominis ATCC 15826]|uniref:Uncharacterized protein n=1 Tax=Cardiobacterium hominis (strain ATCC 15826 / DSM 8339 / NCTC 10426 / 6573) TaxID=638300 RepID=C8N8W7_CARH6|nr:hypothetical protein HMPREF0198_0945 [Cardiobacterium hominis ATCC 15826]